MRAQAWPWLARRRCGKFSPAKVEAAEAAGGDVTCSRDGLQISPERRWPRWCGGEMLRRLRRGGVANGLEKEGEEWVTAERVEGGDIRFVFRFR